MQFQRLPTDVQPFRYVISLILNLDNFTFIGQESIFINVVKPTNTVTLNSVGLKINSASYHNGNNEILSSKSIEYNTPLEIVTIRFENELSLGKEGSIVLDFDGQISDKLNGLYRSKYISNEVVKYAAVTQFAPTDARRCFPCWDEPAIKATFEMNLTVPEELVAISNMPIKSTTKNQCKMKTVSFERSPIMSTYLVAFIVCDYDSIKNHDGNKKISVFAPKDKIKHGEFNLEVAVRALSYFESYFNIPYPLEKIDLVSVADFSFGAMENWGLITFREATILVDPQSSSTVKKETAALTVAHELAHQWFGNLVTMEWWTDLWLNEGYASFMEYLCIDHLYPEYNIWTLFLTQRYIKALELDALANTHPIEVLVSNPSEISEIFDEISYCKGSSVLRMIHDYIGDDDFRKGMHLYLSKHAYSNVKTEDLWDALKEASGKPVSSIMSTWTKLSGFPLVSVTERNSSDPKVRVFTLSQEKFFVNGLLDKNDSTWAIPVSFIGALNPGKVLKKVILDEKTKDIEIEGVPKDKWIKINAGTVGFFRTLYSNDLLKKLLLAIQEQSLPAFDRLGLIDDLFTTAQAGRVSIVEYLKLMKEFKNEDNYTVWSFILKNLRKISNILLHLDDVSHKLKSFGRNLLMDIHFKLGWTPEQNENHLDTLLRILVLSQLVEFGDETVINEAQHRFQMHITKQSILPPDFRSLVYRAVLSVGNYDTFKKLMTIYRETDVHEEKNRILSSLGAIRDENILMKILEFSISEEVRAQDVPRVIESVTTTYQGRLLTWQYFKNNWQIFVKRCQSGTLMKTIVEIVTGKFVTEEIIQDIEDFFEKNHISGTERTIKQRIEIIKFNAAWLNRDKEPIEKFLKTNEKLYL